MASSIRKNLAALVISLALPVISLPAPASALVAAPAIDAASIKVMTDGLKAPVGLAMDASGMFYVADPMSGGVRVLNKFGALVSLFKTAAPPQRVAIALNGDILVSQGAQVSVYNNNGVELRRLKKADGITDYVFGFASGVAVHPATGEIYVADAVAKVVLKFNAAGTYTGTSFGVTAAISAEYLNSMLNDVVVSDEYSGATRINRVFVVDSGLGSIFVFNDAGVYDRTYCALGSGASATNGYLCQLSMPQGLALEYTTGAQPAINRLYVADSFQSSVIAIDPGQAVTGGTTYGNGVWLKFIGQFGWQKGRLMTPGDVIFDSMNKRLVVSNGYGNLTAYPVDGGSNPAGASLSVLPSFTVNVPPSNVTVPTVQLSGARNSADVRIFVEANTAAKPDSTAYPTSNDWSCVINSLVQGRNDITVKGVDAAGNVHSQVVQVWYLPSSTGGSAGNTVAPAGPVLSVYGLPADSATSTQVQNFSGTASNFEKVTVSLNGSATQPVDATGGVFSVPVVLNNAGLNTVTFVATDKAGSSVTDKRNITLNMAAPMVTVSAPADGAFVRSGSVAFAGKVDRAGTTCKIAGADAAVDGTLAFGGTVNLSAGYNNVVVACTNGAQTSSVKRTVIYAPALPEVSVVSPAQDVPTKDRNQLVQGTATPGSTVTVLPSGVTTTVGSAGAFNFTAALAEEKPYAYTIVVTDASGNVSTTTRTLIYDVTPPAVSAVLGQASVNAISGAIEPGAVVASVVDGISKAQVPGSVITMGNGSFSATLGSSYNPYTLLITALDQAGNQKTVSLGKPDGDCNADGVVATDDASFCLDIVAGKVNPTVVQRAHCDVGPLTGAGQVNPNGQVDLTDCIMVLRKAQGLW